MFKSSKGLAHLVVVFGVLILVALGVFIYSKVFPSENPELLMDGSYYVAKFLPQPKGEFPPNWKTYENKDLGFEFMYSENLVVSETGGVVTLNHSIPYENSGGCDMSGGTQAYDSLDDFNVTFEIKPSKIVPDYTDGDYQAGSLIGVWQYEGAEGCGNDIYYFYLPGDKTLVVKKAVVQAFTGISTAWDVDAILEIPGVIDKEESDRIFDRLLSTFKLTYHDTSVSNNTADWETYKDDIAKISFKYPPVFNYNKKSDAYYMISQNPIMRLWIFSEGNPMYNECMQLDETFFVGERTVKKYSRVIGPVACSGLNPTDRQIWVVKTNSEGYQPGIILSYSSIESEEVENIFNQIFLTFEFME